MRTKKNKKTAEHSALWIARNKRLWGTAHAIGMEESDLRYLVAQVTGSESISGLTEAQQVQILSALQLLQVHQHQRRRAQKKRIDAPRLRSGQAQGPPKGGGGSASLTASSTGATWRQIELLRMLAGQIEWGDGALRMWLKRWWKVDHEKWLTASKATRAITAMKAIVARQKRSADDADCADKKQTTGKAE